MPVQESKIHVGLLVSPGMGHLIPLMELANRLILHHNLEVTLFVVRTGSSSSAESLLLQKAAVLDSLSIVPLSPPLDDIIFPSNASLVDKIKAMMVASFPALRSSIAAAKPRPVALIVDLFGTQAIALARELGMLAYVFITSNAWFLSLTLFFSCIDRQIVDDHVYKREPLIIPGCRPVRFEDTLGTLEANEEGFYEDFERFAKEVGSAEGILANTWQDLEPTTLKALEEAGTLSKGKVNQVPIYPIGPLTRGGDEGLESEVLKWLDRQPGESVMYVSFGSGGTLCGDQIRELAWGLELSQQRFVWVVRPPVGTNNSDSNSAGAYFTAGADCESERENSPEYLPEGFVKRTKKVGLVVPMWGPQAEILMHPSVGGFLTHCGWNSSLESIVNGVPMIGWPLYAEQKMNAALLTDELGVGVRVRAAPETGLVGREEIERKVRKIMEGDDEDGVKGIRERVKAFMESGEKAVSKGGSSYNSLAQIATECDIFRRRTDN